jgi:L-asparaginase II
VVSNNESMGNVSPDFDLVARTLRGGFTENWHFGAAAVMSPQGDLRAKVGNPMVRAFMRSAAKPIQALPLVMAGGPAQLDLSDEDLALLCASHAGTDSHVQRVASLLERGGFDVEDLACGTHEPLCEVAADELRRGGRRPSALHSNCSGNHAGVLLACNLLGHPTRGYTKPGHPLKVEILRLIARFCGLEVADIEIAVDGCGLPTYRTPLAATARAWARLADPLGGGLAERESDAVCALVGAMASSPEMVAGCGRFTTRLIEVTEGRVIGKEGADGFYAAAVRAPSPMGLALKIADGSELCRDGVVLEILRQLGAISEPELENLRRFHRSPLINRAGDAVGEVVPEVKLIEIPATAA